MATICANCGLENTMGRTICKRCRASLTADSVQGTNSSFMTRTISVVRTLRWYEQLRLWLVWTLTTAACGTLIGMAGQIGACDAYVLALLLFPAWLCAGFGMGVFQWLVLRGTVQQADVWIVAAGIGWVLAWFAQQIATVSVAGAMGISQELWSVLAPEQTQFPGLLVGAIVLGTAQALMLRRFQGPRGGCRPVLQGVSLRRWGWHQSTMLLPRCGSDTVELANSGGGSLSPTEARL
jgi:hypothetical protein